MTAAAAMGLADADQRAAAGFGHAGRAASMSAAGETAHQTLSQQAASSTTTFSFSKCVVQKKSRFANMPFFVAVSQVERLQQMDEGTSMNSFGKKLQPLCTACMLLWIQQS